MNERIKKILEELGLKKVEFAERLHISRPYASELCSGAKAPSDRTISDICREFGVREAWLREGEGEMFVQDTQSEQVAAFLADLTKDDSDTFKKRFIEMLAGLSPSDWELLERMAEKITQKKREACKGFPRMVAGGSSDQVACVHPHKPQLAEIGFFQQFQNGVDVILSCHFLQPSYTFF